MQGRNGFRRSPEPQVRTVENQARVKSTRHSCTFHNFQTGSETYAFPGLPGRWVRFAMINTGFFRRVGRQLLRSPGESMDSNERIRSFIKNIYCAAIKIE
jgi:hypothetical protein